jgi:hypothetical protein
LLFLPEAAQFGAEENRAWDFAAVAEADPVRLAGRGGKRGHLFDEVVGGANLRRALPPLAAQKLGGGRTIGPSVPLRIKVASAIRSIAAISALICFSSARGRSAALKAVEQTDKASAVATIVRINAFICGYSANGL